MVGRVDDLSRFRGAASLGLIVQIFQYILHFVLACLNICVNCCMVH